MYSFSAEYSQIMSDNSLFSNSISILSRCLKITVKVSFNIASEASYVYMDKSVTRQVIFNKTKNGGKCRNRKNSNGTFLGIFKQCDCVSCWGFLLWKKTTKSCILGLIFALSHKVVKATSSQDEVLRLVIPHGKFI